MTYAEFIEKSRIAGVCFEFIGQEDEADEAQEPAEGEQEESAKDALAAFLCQFGQYFVNR
jgi:hypothetical protein